MEALLSLARRRAGDEKAGVRRAGVQLLEALLLMRCAGAGGAAPEAPSEADIAAIEAATADPLASSRSLEPSPGLEHGVLYDIQVLIMLWPWLMRPKQGCPSGLKD